MKHLTAVVTAAAILISLSAPVWAKAEAPAPESALQAELPGEAVPPATETLTALGASNEGTVNPEGNTVAENGSGVVMEINEGVVENNNGTIGANTGTVEANNGLIMANGGTVIVNTGSLVNFTSGDAVPEVTFNTGEVGYSITPDEVKYNAGEIYTEYPHGDGFDRTTYYGVVYANENGDGLLLPHALCEQLLSEGADAEAVLSELAESRDLIFTEAVSDSGDPALNGVITLLSEAEVPFQRSGYCLGGWMDANQNNAPYALGQTVTVTAPLWLIPQWVLIPLPSSTEESGPVDPALPQSQSRENKTAYILVPAAAGNSTVWDFSNVVFTSSDGRVTKDSSLPAPALVLSSGLAEVLRSRPLKVEFDGEILPAGYFSLSFRQDGTAVLLFSRTFIGTLEDGEHEIILCLKGTEIYVTMLLTEPEPEERSLRARKSELNGAFTNMPQSSAGSQKGKSG